jgi:hypothetical protein
VNFVGDRRYRKFEHPAVWQVFPELHVGSCPAILQQNDLQKMTYITLRDRRWLGLAGLPEATR